MATALQCDRCKKLISSGFIPDLIVREYQTYYGEIRYDLCHQCTQDLRNFLSNMPVDKAETEDDHE